MPLLKETNDPRMLLRIFEWFATGELILARLVMFVLFLVGLWTVVKGLQKRSAR